MLNRVAERPVASSAKRSTAPTPQGSDKPRFSLEPSPTETSLATQSRALVPGQPAGLGHTVRVAMNRLERQRNAIDRAVQQAGRGATFSPGELLVLQSRVYTYSRELEVVSRLVDRTVSSVKTTLNTQV